jgi:hypothetical protein
MDIKEIQKKRIINIAERYHLENDLRRAKAILKLGNTKKLEGTYIKSKRHSNMYAEIRLSIIRGFIVEIYSFSISNFASISLVEISFDNYVEDWKKCSGEEYYKFVEKINKEFHDLEIIKSKKKVK